MFEILVICTGNRNRSPIAEAALRQATEGLSVRVSSVGLLDLGCSPALPETLEVASCIGLDINAHRSRAITEVDVAKADLLLGLEWQHVAAAVVDYGAPADRAFTLLELAELLEDSPSIDESDPERRARSLVQSAHERKKAMGRSPLGASVHDPFGGPMAGYEEMAALVKQAAEGIAGQLFGATRAPSAS